MSWSENVLIAISVGYILALWVDKDSKLRIKNWISLAGLGILLGHVLFDVSNWQLYPLYFFVSMHAAATFVGIILRKQNQQPKDNRRVLLRIGILAMSISMVLMYIFPVLEIPEPSGVYPVGSFTFELTDPSRLEGYGAYPEKGALRRIKVQAWYPAESISEKDRMLWFPDGIAIPRALAQEMHLPFFALDHTMEIYSNAYYNSPMSTAMEMYPIIILSHGWKGFRNLHTDIAEMLASHGYVVFGIDHTYGSQMTVFKDGFEAGLDHEALPDRDDSPAFIEYANQLVYTYAGDIKLVLDELDHFNQGTVSEIIRGHLDISNIGLLGHSTGGGAGVAVALEDERVNFLVGMDAWVEPIGSEKLKKGLTIPAFFLRSEQWVGGINDSFLVPFVSSSNQSQIVDIEGATHIDFTMSAMFSNITGLIGLTGDDDREASMRIQHDYILEFFERGDE